MPDNLTPAARFLCMSHNRGKNTSPELILRRKLHMLGYRYRLHRRDLPGAPDLVFPSRNVAIFVNGCFWHRHICAKGRSTPKTNRAFWKNKFAKNIALDQRNISALSKRGWKVLIIWECEIMHSDRWMQKACKLLKG
jgi:DNA mismatch endonuclease, patch repair protein